MPDIQVKKVTTTFWRRKGVRKLTLWLVFFALVFSFTPTVLPFGSLPPSQASEARKATSKIVKPLMSSQNAVNIELYPAQLKALSQTISYTVPAVQFRINSNEYGIVAAASITVLPHLLYMNFQCWLIPDDRGLVFNDCKFGHLPIYGKLVEKTSKALAWLLFGKEAKITLDKFLANTQLLEDKIVVQFTKPENLKGAVESRVTSAFEMIQDIRQFNGVDTETITIYLDEIKKYQVQHPTSAELIGHLFALAQQRSIENDPVDENYATLWALCLYLGAPEFARIVAMPVDYSLKAPLNMGLRGRLDLRLHFFFSVALRLSSERDISNNIGKLKEILDSSQGGSGFSFRDLTADKAGVELAEFAIADETSARQVQAVLAGTNNEDLFIPALHDLPEGLSEKRFIAIFGDDNSDTFLALEGKIAKRIAALPVYGNYIPRTQPGLRHEDKADQPQNTLIPPTLANWYQVDTHMHTQYSDGRFSIQELADKASDFGCAAIAITDHGDNGLQKVYSASYFTDLAKAQESHPELTIIPALEWNIPPLKGREHVTLLLPETPNQLEQLQLFRNKFDNYKASYDVNTISPQPAFQWLKDNYPGPVKPILIYNHPSRKNHTRNESFNDMRQWRSATPFFIGMSGAPGHQRKRGDDNGSYTENFRTIHGWDPAVAQVASDWDKLLQQQIPIYAARAPSDFHNTQMDYWPCQFSSTHILAPNARTNSLLTAFQQGHFWAQHGHLLDQLDYRLIDAAGKEIAMMGDMVKGTSADLTASLNLRLNNKDWQGFNTQLDEVTAVIITTDQINTVSFLPKSGQSQYSFSVPVPEHASWVAIRWFGRSIQPEQHHYQFFTNPIMVYR
jgi:hypothetical protein